MQAEAAVALIREALQEMEAQEAVEQVQAVTLVRQELQTLVVAVEVVMETQIMTEAMAALVSSSFATQIHLRQLYQPQAHRHTPLAVDTEFTNGLLPAASRFKE
jgi:hypothetical protein